MAEPTPIHVEEVNLSYGTGTLRKQILFEISVEIRPGEIVIVSGPSGSGKTTLLTLIGALRSVQEGSLQVLGQQLRGASPRTLENVRKRIGYIFQAHNLLDAVTASQNVQMSLLLHPHGSSREVEAKADEMLESVGLADRMTHKPEQLSGGERQRVAIARAMVMKPSIMLADEPTGNLDRESGLQVLDLLGNLNNSGLTLLVVTHNPEVADRAHRVIKLIDGRIAERKINREVNLDSGS